MPSPNPLGGIEDANAVAQAILDTIREPLLVLDKDQRVVLASRAFYRAFQVRAEETLGRLLHELGEGEWNIPFVRALRWALAPKDCFIEAYEVERDFPLVGHRVMLVNARKVFYEGRRDSSTILAIEDVTERLNANIVSALAGQLSARVSTLSGPAGTRVTITNARILNA